MIYHDLSHGSPEWFRARLGLATASCFDQIITPKTASPSSQMDGYANRLIAELITGESAEKFQSYWMERGALMEADAGAAYEAITDLALARGGFITDDNMTYGASPDRRVVRDGEVVGAVEIKCPSPATHIENLLRGQAIDPAYRAQVQGQILVGGFEFVDWFSYHPSMPSALVRTYRDDVFCDRLADCLLSFQALMDDKIQALERIGVVVPKKPIIDMYRAEIDWKTDYIVTP